MTEGIITTVIVAIVAPALTLILQQVFARRKNKADYGDNLLDVVNKISESLKKAREEIAQMDNTLRQLDTPMSGKSQTCNTTKRKGTGAKRLTS